MNDTFRRDQTPVLNGDSLLPQLRATEAVYRTAYQTGYDQGYLAGMREAKKIMEEAFKDWKKQAT